MYTASFHDDAMLTLDRWTWTGGSGIKSFANAGYSIPATQLSKISAIDTTWKWSYSGSGILADVAYDTFTSSTGSGNAEYEIMVWMDAIGGAGPISSSYVRLPLRSYVEYLLTES